MMFEQIETTIELTDNERNKFQGEVQVLAHNTAMNVILKRKGKTAEAEGTEAEDYQLPNIEDMPSNLSMGQSTANILNESCQNDANNTIKDKSDMCSLSSLSSESDLSMALEREMDEPTNCDELPTFEIRAFSSLSRSPSPIDNDFTNEVNIETPKQKTRSPCHQNNPEYVPLHEINAQISPPSDESTCTISRSNSLETIFEGVLLSTPPRDKLNNSTSNLSRYTPNRSRTNLMELAAFNRLQLGDKENESPPKPKKQSDALT